MQPGKPPFVLAKKQTHTAKRKSSHYEEKTDVRFLEDLKRLLADPQRNSKETRERNEYIQNLSLKIIAAIKKGYIKTIEHLLEQNLVAPEQPLRYLMRPHAKNRPLTPEDVRKIDLDTTWTELQFESYIGDIYLVQTDLVRQAVLGKQAKIAVILLRHLNTNKKQLPKTLSGSIYTTCEWTEGDGLETTGYSYRDSSYDINHIRSEDLTSQNLSHPLRIAIIQGYVEVVPELITLQQRDTSQAFSSFIKDALGWACRSKLDLGVRKTIVSHIVAAITPTTILPVLDEQVKNITLHCLIGNSAYPKAYQALLKSTIEGIVSQSKASQGFFARRRDRHDERESEVLKGFCAASTPAEFKAVADSQVACFEGREEKCALLTRRWTDPKQLVNKKQSYFYQMMRAAQQACTEPPSFEMSKFPEESTGEHIRASLPTPTQSLPRLESR